MIRISMVLWWSGGVILAAIAVIVFVLYFRGTFRDRILEANRKSQTSVLRSQSAHLQLLRSSCQKLPEHLKIDSVFANVRKPF